MTVVSWQKCIRMFLQMACKCTKYECTADGSVGQVLDMTNNLLVESYDR